MFTATDARGMILAASAGAFWLALSTDLAAQEAVCPKYQPCVDLAPYFCTDTPQSSFIVSVCHDAGDDSMLILLSDTWYMYCGVPQEMFEEFVDAESPGRYYNSFIRSSATGGAYDCPR